MGFEEHAIILLHSADEHIPRNALDTKLFKLLVRHLRTGKGGFREESSYRVSRHLKEEEGGVRENLTSVSPSLFCIKTRTGRRRCIGCLKLQVSFHERVTNYMAPLRIMTYKIRIRTSHCHPVQHLRMGKGSVKRFDVQSLKTSAGVGRLCARKLNTSLS